MTDANPNILGTEKPAQNGNNLREVAALFLRLGATAFGGPAVHIALMKEEVVRRREWLTEAEFLDLLGATNLIPGPNSTEMAIHIGFLRAGWPGLLAAGTCFIVPAFLLTMGFAALYQAFGTLPQMAGVLAGVKPVIVAVVAAALWGLAKTAAKNRFLVVLGIVGIALGLCGVSELAVLFGTGAITGSAGWWRQKERQPFAILLTVLALIGVLIFAPLALSAKWGGSAAFGLMPLFLFFAKTGSVLYGSGYVLLAFLRSDLVVRLGWLTSAQLLDAVAVGQVTPGPVFTTATFIGYLLGGVPGAIVATFGIFLPAFVFVALSGPLVPRLRKSALAGSFLDGINVASLALMATVTVQIAQDALHTPAAIALCLLSALLLTRYRVNSVWLLLAGAVFGLLFAR